VLASGSSGNASLLEVGGFGVLVDFGLGPRTLAGRLDDSGASWHDIHAALLSHTHSDHWNERTLVHFARRGIPLYCHPGHRDTLLEVSPAFADLQAAGLVRDCLSVGQDSDPVHFHGLDRNPVLRCHAIELCHDAGMTCGFRFETAADFLGQTWALAYATDLGTWDDGLADFFANIDVLAVEFNHDVDMERRSGRPAELIARVLGDTGHLSNDQAARLVREVLNRSAAGRLRHLVQLHVSRDCNRPALARLAAQAALAEWDGIEVHTARQYQVGPQLRLRHGSKRVRLRRQRTPTLVACQQPWLPGWEEAG
jgi:phosphoribosyl 1,2-cyclic phosphodiesterase